MDLYWFDPANVARSADAFWTRYAPLYRGVAGYKGVVLSVGLTANYILTFSGDLDQAIALPDTRGQELGHRIAGQLDGDTARRQLGWRARFAASPRSPQSLAYGRWTYRALRQLTDALRARARRGGVKDFKVASFTVGQDSAYLDRIPFARAHPEAFTMWREQASGTLASSSHLDPANALHADQRPLAAYPRGIPEGLPVHAFFASQWAALARAVGLDGIMLRDSMTFPRAYTRYGPYGAYVPDKAVAERMTDGLAALVRETKKATPATLVMLYSSAATAMTDWRANGIDLERIAREGYVDIFVDQSWSGAWGEVGVRQQSFWNAPILGWTYQLGYLLEHAAVLADTRVRHYPLVETFDAWESWDTIHTTRDRLRWSIWAYSHAGVKTPRGLRMPAGSYISWGHHGRDLLSPEDVAFLAGELDAAGRDAWQTADIAGATMVYSRDAAAGQMDRLQPGFDPRDLTDEQVGSIIKWPVPILSITRAEWVPQVRSDLFLFGATTDLPAAQVDAIKALAARGQAMTFFGSVASATNPAFAAMLGVSSAPHVPGIADRLLRVSPGAAWPSELIKLSAFDAPPPRTRLTAPEGSIVYAFGDAAGLVLDQAGGHNLSLWDPVPIWDYWFRPLRDLLNGDPRPFPTVAATLDRQLAQAGGFAAATIDAGQSGTIAAWTLRDGSVRMLAGNLEEGLRDDADRSRVMTLRLPRSWTTCDWRSAWTGPAHRISGSALTLQLPAAGSALLRCDRAATTRH